MRAIALVVVAACGSDPSLRVIVEHDPDYVDLVDRTTIVVYEGENVTCSAIEFGDFAGPQLDLLEVARVETDGETTSGDFDSVFSRAGHKAIVARGIDDDTGVVLAQCADVDEIGENDSVTISTIAAATVSIVNADDGKRGVLVLVTDPRSKPIDKRPVSWRLFGAAGTSANSPKLNDVSDGVWEPKAPTCTTADGEAIIHPTPPRVPGGFAVRARVSWAAEPPPLFTLFTELDPGVSGVLDRSFDKPCALLRAGALRNVVCLEAPNRAREYMLTGTTLAPARVQAFAEPVIALVSIERDADLDVYAITDAGKWIGVLGAPGPTAGAWNCAGCTTFDLQIAPACDDTGSRLVGRVGAFDATAEIKTMDIKGGNTQPFRENAARISNAGCVTELQADGTAMTRQSLVLENLEAAGAAGAVVFDCAADAMGCRLPLLNEGVGFAVADAEHRMIVSSFDATGTVLSAVVTRPSDKPNPTTMRRENRFIERSRQPAAAPPAQLVSGRFDTDEDPDLIWHFSTQLARASNIQIAYAREVDGSPITAILPTGGTMVDLLVGKLNDDQFDDIVFVVDRIEMVGNTLETNRRMQVIAAGIEYAPVQVIDDPPCQ